MPESLADKPHCTNGCPTCCIEKVDEIAAHSRADIELVKAKSDANRDSLMLIGSIVLTAGWGGFSAWWFSLHQVLPPVPDVIAQVVAGGFVGLGAARIADKIAKGKKGKDGDS